MKLAVYAGDRRQNHLVLTASCMQPSNACEHLYGPMRFLGTVVLDQSLLDAISQPVSRLTDDLEFVVHCERAARAVHTLINREAETGGPAHC
jgi:hypothetical protein